MEKATDNTSANVSAVYGATLRRLCCRARLSTSQHSGTCGFSHSGALPPEQATSIADLKWFEVFNDPELQGLTRTALQRNYDLRDAVARVEQARADLGITRSNQYPNFGAGASVEINRLSRDGATPIGPQVLPSQNRN
jgi:outer membrane protein TolC